MIVQHYQDVPATAPLPGVSKRIVCGETEGARNFIMRIFEVAPGHNSPIHTHPWEHEVFILAGRGVARDQNGQERPIGEGSVLFIPADENHCMINRGDETLRFVCIIPAGME